MAETQRSKMSSHHRSSKNVIPAKTQHKYNVYGTVNGVTFKLEGNGNGTPYEGKADLYLDSTTGQLPFPIQILVPFISIPTIGKNQDNTVELYKNVNGYEFDRTILFGHPNGGTAWMKTVQKVIHEDNMITCDYHIVDGAMPPNIDLDSTEPIVDTIRPFSPNRVIFDTFVAWRKRDGQMLTAACETTVMLPSGSNLLSHLQWNMAEFNTEVHNNGMAISINETRNTFRSVSMMCK